MPGKTVKLWVILLLLITVFILNPFPSHADETGRKSYGMIRGMVRGMVINKGKVAYIRLPDVTVSVEFTSFSATTRDDGRFVIKNIPPGKYNLAVDYEGEKLESKQFEVFAGRVTEVESLTVLMGMNKELPKIKPGSLVAAFSAPPTKGNLYKEQQGDGNTPTSGLAFYSPDNYHVYMEIVMEDRPLFITYGRDENEVYVASDRGGLDLWDPNKPAIVKEFDVPGIVTDFRWNIQRTRLYVSFFSTKNSGIAVIDGEKKEITDIILPPQIGLFASTFPINNTDSLFAVLARIKDGRILKIEPNPSGKPIITKNRNVGKLPTSMTYLPDKQNIMVISASGKSMITLDSGSFKVKNILSIDGKPVRVIDGFKGSKAYICVFDKNQVIAVDGGTGKSIATISVGDSPYQMCRAGYHIFVVNRKDRTISIIDGRKDEVIANTLPESYFRIVDVDIMPEKENQ